MLMFTESKAYRIFTGSNKKHAPISLFANSYFTLLSRYDLNRSKSISSSYNLFI